MSTGVHTIPASATNGAKTSGPRAKPIDPPVMWTDIARPRRKPPTLCTRAAAGGWKAAPPRPPTIRIAAAVQTLVARPSKLSTATESSGPAMSSTRGLQRSAIAPNASWETELESCRQVCSRPAVASVSPSRGISTGSNGA